MAFHVAPMWIEAHASYNESARSTTTLQMTFNAGLVNDAAFSAGQVDDLEPLTVKNDRCKRHQHRKWSRQRHKDIACQMVTDLSGSRPAKREITESMLCYGFAGVSGPTISSIKYSPVTLKPSDNFYPGQFVFTLKLNDGWGLCYTAHDTGFAM